MEAVPARTTRLYTTALRRIDFVEAMLHSSGIVPRMSAVFDEPGALAIASMSYLRRLQSFKPANQLYHGIGYRIAGSETIRLDRPASYPSRIGRTGMTAIVPAQEESSWESLGPHEMVHFYLSARCLSALAEEIFEVDGEGVILQEAGFHRDPTIGRFAMMCLDRMREADPMTELELNAVAHLLGLHLLRRYSNLAGRAMPDAGQKSAAGLSPKQIQRVREYVHANLSRDMALADLAKQAQLSPHYFSMRFKHSLGVSPHRYVLTERIREAQKRLAAQRMSISAVAMSLGFADQSHFSQTFRRFTGTTPKRFQSRC
jgi:AraC family transcriptional regulator